MTIIKTNIILVALVFLFSISPFAHGESMTNSKPVATEGARLKDKSSSAKALPSKSPSRIATVARTGTATKTPSPSRPKPDLDLTSTQEDKLLALLNNGTTTELTAIRGIAATRAEAIVGSRPFQNIHEVILVPGVGDATFDQILKHGKTLTRPAAKPSKS